MINIQELSVAENDAIKRLAEELERQRLVHPARMVTPWMVAQAIAKVFPTRVES